MHTQEYAVGDAFIDEVQVDKLGGFIEKVGDLYPSDAILPLCSVLQSIQVIQKRVHAQIFSHAPMTQPV